MTNTGFTSWGRFPRFEQHGVRLQWRSDALPPLNDSADSLLPYGAGRSYGDVCLNRGGKVLSTAALSHFIAFDSESGVVRCESGVTLAELNRLTLPAGWLLPVSPGTARVTVGGAVANDVHGKNHHRAGSFGCHVRCFELLRSDGSRRICAPDQHPELFAATIGGLGLTGLLTWVEIELRPVSGPWLDTETLKFAGAHDFVKLSNASDEGHEYTVAWIDCAARGSHHGRGLFTRANHADDPTPAQPRRALKVPFTPPFSLVNRLSVRAFNALWYRRQRQRRSRARQSLDAFFYPLDAVRHWNRLYGAAGLVQHQAVLPGADGPAACAEMLTQVARSGQGSFLAVAKVFGARRSPGLLSFPRPGLSLALDFRLRPEVLRLLGRLDAITLECGGAVYPAKDACMSARVFRAGFPRWEAFATHIDPAFSSSFWRRVTGAGYD